MADEKLAPQAGDVWIDKDGEAVFVTLTYDGRVKYAFIGSAYMSEDDVVGFADGLTLLVRDGKPLCQQPSPRRHVGFGRRRVDQFPLLVGHSDAQCSAALPPCCRSSATTLYLLNDFFGNLFTVDHKFP